MTPMTIAGWIVWSAVCLYAVAWNCYAFSQLLKKRKWLPCNIETGALLALLLVWTLRAPLHKLHLLYLVPLAWLGPLLYWWLTIRRLQRPSLHLTAWLGGCLVLLAFLTWPPAW